MGGTQVDYSQPLATLLKDGTHEAHDAVATSQGAKLLLSGSLAKGEYVRYLMMLWHVYSELEAALDKHATNPSLEGTYNPTLLSRTEALSSDIAYLLEVEESSWQSHPVYTSLISPMPTSLANYVSRIRTLSASPDPSPLLAHAYVRYLGDLSGGQNMRHILAKSYELDEHEGLGISFYDFKELRGSGNAGLGEMKRIKEWYRSEMNKAGDVAPQCKPQIVSEASTAFRLNAGLFEELAHISIEDDNKLKLSKEAPTVVFESKADEGGFPVSSVVAVITAVCIAHFALVVGGFTGNSGYQKLLYVEEWLSNFWAGLSSSTN
ncbi:heme oxygenase 1 [Coprinopsis sp. MPI-PUGE-AT-0042]|nr:heme oxygenase 1 [Coprinopsis sp. MPI-PUGE-AT-0042]